MRQSSDHYLPVLVIAAVILLFVVAAWIGGPDYGPDVAAIHALAAERTANPGLTARAITVTEIGGWPGMMTILAVAVAGLALARRWRDAVSLVGVVLGGRVAIELLKLAIDRPRPSITPYPVEVASLSFPSGHAGNSMITFLALALIVAPARWRGVAAAVGIGLSLAIGATRPLLGVHWPSDVVGGWAFGIGWVVALGALSRRWRSTAE